MENSLDPVALFRQREEKRAQNNPNANVDERVEQDIIREIRDGNGSLEQKQNLYNQLSPEAKRSTPISPELKNSLQPSQEQLQKQRDALMESMWSNPTHDTQDAITKIDRELENRFAVDPLYKRLGKDDPNLLNARREKLVSKMLSEPDEATQTEIRDIDEKLKKINSPKPTESQDQPVATPEAVKNELPLPPEWDLLEEEETNDTDKGDIVITQKEFDEMLEKYDVDEFDTIDLDLEEANNKLKELLEKHAVEPLSSDEAEIMLLIQNAKLKELTKLVTEYMYTDTDRGAVFGNEYYSNQTSQILASLDQIVEDVRLDTSNTPDEVDFIKKYAALEKQLVNLRANFIKNNFSGVDLAENEAQIEYRIVELFKQKNEEPEVPFHFDDEPKIDTPANPLQDNEPHIVVAEPATAVTEEEEKEPGWFKRMGRRIKDVLPRRKTSQESVPTLTAEDRSSIGLDAVEPVVKEVSFDAESEPKSVVETKSDVAWELPPVKLIDREYHDYAELPNTEITSETALADIAAHLQFVTDKYRTFVEGSLNRDAIVDRDAMCGILIPEFHYMRDTVNNRVIQGELSLDRDTKDYFDLYSEYTFLLRAEFYTGEDTYHGQYKGSIYDLHNDQDKTVAARVALEEKILQKRKDAGEGPLVPNTPVREVPTNTPVEEVTLPQEKQQEAVELPPLDPNRILDSIDITPENLEGELEKRFARLDEAYRRYLDAQTTEEAANSGLYEAVWKEEAFQYGLSRLYDDFDTIVSKIAGENDRLRELYENYSNSVILLSSLNLRPMLGEEYGGLPARRFEEISSERKKILHPTDSA